MQIKQPLGTKIELKPLKRKRKSFRSLLVKKIKSIFDFVRSKKKIKNFVNSRLETYKRDKRKVKFNKALEKGILDFNIYNNPLLEKEIWILLLRLYGLNTNNIKQVLPQYSEKLSKYQNEIARKLEFSSYYELLRFIKKDYNFTSKKNINLERVLFSLFGVFKEVINFGEINLANLVNPENFKTSNKSYNEDYLKRLDYNKDQKKLFFKNTLITGIINLNHIYLKHNEIEIFILFLYGKTTKEIAGMKYLAPQSVVNHFKNIAKKTGFDSVSEFRSFVYKHKEQCFISKKITKIEFNTNENERDKYEIIVRKMFNSKKVDLNILKNYYFNYS